MSDTTMTTEIAGALVRYTARGWATVPVHRPNPETGACSCGRAECPKPGKHPDHRFWPDGSASAAHFAGRNLGVKLGPDSANLADVDLDCGEAIAAGRTLLPVTSATFGRAGQVAHMLYTVSDRAARYAKLQDPARSGSEATIAELRWPEWDEDERRFKSIQTVLPPSLHASGTTVTWVSEGDPAVVPGADLCAAVRHVGAAVLIARYARPKERHALVLLIANLLARAGWDDDRIVSFAAAVFDARNDPDKAAKVRTGEGAGAAADARKRLQSGKPMTGLPALREMLDPALEVRVADAVVMKIKGWLGVPDRAEPARAAARSAVSEPEWEPPVPLPEPDDAPPFPLDLFPAPVADYWAACAAALHVPVDYVAGPGIAVLGAALGRARAAEVKPGYAESPLFWLAVVAPPGSAKSPALRAARGPLDAAEARWRAAHARALEAFEAERARYELELKEWKKAPDADPPAKPAAPILRQSVLDDTTTEAARRVLRDNPRGAVVLMDELTAFTRQLNQYRQGGRGADKTFWLSGWNGRGTCKNNRAGTHDAGPLVVTDPFTAVAGMLCPDSVGELRDELRREGAANDGWADRFLLAFPQPRPAAEESWASVPEPLAAGYAAVVEALLALEPEADDDGPVRPVVARFDAAARAAWQAFTRAVADRANALPPGDAYRGVLSKLKHYAVRFAALFHWLGAGAPPPPGTAVCADSVARAVRAVWYFEAHGRRCLGVGAPETQAARLLLPALAALPGDRFTKRELYRRVRGQTAFRRAGHLDAPLRELVAHGYLRATGDGSERGRPSERFALNPLWDRSDPALAPAGGFLAMAKTVLAEIGHVAPNAGISSTEGVFGHIGHATVGGSPKTAPGAPEGAGGAESAAGDDCAGGAESAAGAGTGERGELAAEYPFEELL